MAGVARTLAMLTGLVLIPTVAFAQASIAGVARDSSGGVMPGVTVEAASPVLIEKVRSVVTDGNGAYRIVDLRPGTYTVTFTLTGFSTIRREGIELSGSFTATVNAELLPGAIEETITVTGVAPVVDIQSAAQERVINAEVGDTLPTSRLQSSFAVLIPGVYSGGGAGTNVSGMGTQDVGGSTGDQIVQLRIHGGRPAEQRLMVNGLPAGRVDMPELGAYTPNLGATQEIAVETGALTAESSLGGIRLNVIPKEGGNTYSGSMFASFSHEDWASSNLTAEHEAQGLTQANSIKRNGDFNPAFGGPLKRDKVWFWVSGRYMFYENYAAGMWVDSTRNDPNVWTFNPDLSQPAVNKQHVSDGQGRLTWQMTDRHRLAGAYTNVGNCKCYFNLTPTVAEGPRTVWRLNQIALSWTAPLTNRLLFEAGVLSNFSEQQDQGYQPDTNPLNISVNEQSTQLVYKLPTPGVSTNAGNFLEGDTHKNYYRASISYVTGTHALKVGFSNGSGAKDVNSYMLNPDLPFSYRFNLTIPNRVILYGKPFTNLWNLDADLTVYAEDKWTSGRLSATGGLVFTYFGTSFGESRYLPSVILPNRDFTLPATDQLGWKDITPRMGGAYDLFGTGKTAVKASFSKYLYGESVTQFWGNPSLDIVNQAFRNWTDRDSDFFPDCDLTNFQPNGECPNIISNTDFGKPVKGATFDPGITHGWGNRPYNWEFSVGAQHELVPRVAVEGSFFRRWYGNFVLGAGTGSASQLLTGTAGDARNIFASDLDHFCITAPVNPGLPNGGGYDICGLYDLNPAKVGQPLDKYITFSEAYGNQVENWQGVDVGINARPGGGVLLQGGVSTGRRLEDVCNVVSSIPEVFTTVIATLTPQSYCRVVTPYQTQVKLLGTYTLPRIDVQLAGTFQSLPGPELVSELNVPSAEVALSLGRLLSGGAANATVNLIPPGTMYGDRLNQLDLRFSKRFVFGAYRTTVNFDLYNALNASPSIRQSTSYATFLQPQQLLTPRFIKISGQISF